MPDSAALLNLSRCRYLPRKMPSTSLTATLTLVLPDSSAAATAGGSGGGAIELSFIQSSPCGRAGAKPGDAALAAAIARPSTAQGQAAPCRFGVAIFPPLSSPTGTQGQQADRL